MITDNNDTGVRLVFPSVADKELEAVLSYITVKDYCFAAELEMEDGRRFPVSFLTPSGAKAMTEELGYYSGPCLIIVAEMKFELMQAGAIWAWKQGFFKNVVPS